MAPGKKYAGRDWVKGQSGNPKGGPRKPEQIRPIIREYMNKTKVQLQKIIEKGDKLKVKQILVIKYLIRAMEGNMKAIQWITSQVDGKLPEYLDVSTKGQPISLSRDKIDAIDAAIIRNGPKDMVDNTELDQDVN